MKGFHLVILMLLTHIFYGQDIDLIYKQSMEAHANKDYGRFLSLTKKALELHPSKPALLYNLAASYSLNDSVKHAYRSLKRLLSWNYTIKFKEDNDFDNFLASARYGNSLDSIMNHYGHKNEVGVPYASFNQKRHLEDLVLLDTLLFVTDVYNGELIKYSTKENEPIASKSFDLPVMALASAKESNAIWLSTAKIPLSIKKGLPSSKPEIIELDAVKGNIKSRVTLWDDFVAGSMVFGKNGNLYVSNSSKPQIVIIDTQTKRIKNTINIREGFNLQGITIDLKNDFVFVADYIKGIAIIDIKNDYQITWLKSDKYLLKGIDGLAYKGNGQLLAIQNNSNPKKVIKIKIDGLELKSVTLLDNNLNFTGEPTNGKYYEQLGFIYIANSPWPHYDNSGQALFENWEEQKILRIKSETL